MPRPRPTPGRAIGRVYRQPQPIAVDAQQVPPADPVQTHALQIFIVAPSPPEFHISGAQFGRQFGHTVYHLTLFDPEGSDSD